MVRTWAGKWLRPRPHPRSGITLTEILIAIMIMGIGLVSLATLFPIGLLRLRDATRYSRSATLLQTAAADASARGLLTGSVVHLRRSIQLPIPSASRRGSRRRMRGHTIRSPRTRPPTTATGSTVIAPLHTWEPTPRWTTKAREEWPGTAVRLRPALAVSHHQHDQWHARLLHGRYCTRPASPPGSASSGPIRTAGLPSAHGLQRLTNFNRPYVMNGAWRSRSCRRHSSCRTSSSRRRTWSGRTRK